MVRSLRLLLFLCSVASAQIGVQHGSPAAPWNVNYRSVDCKDTITIHVTGSGIPTPDFILGLDGDPALGDDVSFALASIYTIHSGSFVPSRPFDDLTDRMKDSVPCVLNVFLSKSEPKRVVLHVRAAPARHVSLDLESQPRTEFVMGGGSVIYDGRVVMDSGRLHVLKLLALTYVRGSTQSNSEVVRLPTGKYFITAIGLKQHLIENSEISFPPSKGTRFACCENAKLATFKIDVSPAGQVTSAVSVKVPAEESTKLTGLVSSLRIKPFQYDGKYVTAEGYLTLLLESSGRIYYFH